MCSLGIMIYHYSTWTLGVFSADAFLARVGVYGVSIFYILSGITLFHVYGDKIQDFKGFTIDFVTKRIFRIVPLLALVSIIAVTFLSTKTTVANFFSHIIGYFGFYDWSSCLTTGDWSIGNEMVFYAFFILMMFLKKKNQLFFFTFCIMTFFCL